MGNITNNTANRLQNIKETIDLLRASFSEDEGDFEECVSCRVLARNRMAGAAFRQRNCNLCPAVVHSGSTDVNAICRKCAVKEGLCQRCGSDKECVKKDLKNSGIFK